MYGLLLDSVRFYIKQRYGDAAWENICNNCNLSSSLFTSQNFFSDDVIPRLACACAATLPCGLSADSYMELFGKAFVEFTSRCGYSNMLKVYGRSFRDFLDGIDSLHEHLRFGFPKLQSPSFECEEETCDGLTLHYRSRRYGFKYYVIGQVKDVATRYFNMNVNVKVLNEGDETSDSRGQRSHVVYRVIFDNTIFMPVQSEQRFLRQKQQLPLDLVFKISPFSFLIDNNMRIFRAAKDINQYFGENMTGKDLLQVFIVRRPPIQLSWEQVYFSRCY